MKKTVIVVIVLVLLLGVAPWGIGRIAEQRVNAGLDRFIEEAPYLSIVERKWTAGWFRSEQQVTFEVLGPWFDAMNPATVLAEAGKAQAEAAAGEVELEPEEEAGDDAATTSDDAVMADEVDEAAAEDAEESAEPAEPAKPIRFTVRNEILHGPVLWPASLGLVRVNSRLVLSDDIRNKIVEIFGTDEPVRISTRVGFFGGGTTSFTGDGRTVKFKDDAGSLLYQDFELDFGYSKNFDEIEVQGDWPGLEFTSATQGAKLSVRDMYVVGESERVMGELYDSEYKFVVREIKGVGADKAETTVENIRYEVESATDKGYVDMAARLGSGKIRNPSLAQLDFEINEVHYDITLRHLHAETLDQLLTALKAMYSKPVATVADVDATVLAPFKEHGMTLLEHDPQFVIDRIGVVTPDGEAYIKGVVRLSGVTEADFPVGPGLVSKIEADLTVEVTQKLVEKAPNGATAMGLVLDQGFAKREGDKLVSHIVYKGGELMVNDKPLPIPGMGADNAPMEGMEEEGYEEEGYEAEEE